MITIIFGVLLFIIIFILVYGIFKIANDNVYKHLAFEKKMTKMEFGDLRRKYRLYDNIWFTFIGKHPAIFLLSIDEYGDRTKKDLIGYYQPDKQILYYGNPLNEICKELEIY